MAVPCRGPATRRKRKFSVLAEENRAAAHLRRRHRESVRRHKFRRRASKEQAATRTQGPRPGAGGNMKKNRKKKQQAWRTEMVEEEIKAKCKRMAGAIIAGTTLVVTAYLAFGF